MSNRHSVAMTARSLSSHQQQQQAQQSIQADSIWEAINLLRNLETYGGSSDEELGELLGWFLQAEYGNAHENTKKPAEIKQDVKRVMALRTIPSQAFVYWQEYVGTFKTTALTLFIAGVNKKFYEKQTMGVFFF